MKKRMVLLGLFFLVFFLHAEGKYSCPCSPYPYDYNFIEYRIDMYSGKSMQRSCADTQGSVEESEEHIYTQEEEGVDWVTITMVVSLLFTFPIFILFAILFIKLANIKRIIKNLQNATQNMINRVEK